ncbi:hypothetical protein [Terracidiphilus gabretensis]|jgi:hypothetical protein|uniref:hypothetical protein n=1 Tax=Terracidiphilus gabretensis TaxID=1577687 RepID=UPI00071B7A5C|nr:hypothetical protein [Terracidiphilus gabretensis]
MRRNNRIISQSIRILLAAAVLCAISAFFACRPGPSAAAAAATDDSNWSTYANSRFAYSICYPKNLFEPQGESPNGDGQKFLAKDGAQLLVYGSNNALNESINDVFNRTASRLAGASGKVSYKAVKPAWFVLSGQHGSTIFYAKTLYAKDLIVSFELTYDSAQSNVYNPVAAKLASCFAKAP